MFDLRIGYKTEKYKLKTEYFLSWWIALCKATFNTVNFTDIWWLLIYWWKRYIYRNWTLTIKIILDEI